METLDQALGRIWQNEWQHKRSGPTLKSQAEIAVYTIKRIVTGSSGLHPREYVGVTAQQVSSFHVQQATSDWYASGLSPATITKRLNCLSKLGVSIEGSKVHVPKQLKWHLSEANLEKLRIWLDDQYSGHIEPDPRLFHNTRIISLFIFWTCRTGLRVEETLSLRRRDFSGLDGLPENVAVSVPGLKTAASQATLPLSSEAAECAIALFDRADYESDRPSDLMLPLTYEELQPMWQACREFLGAADDPTATLKALRRSAARYLHVDCGMPLDMVRQYLRHESINTTLEYLRLTGGYGTEEMRRFLK